MKYLKTTALILGFTVLSLSSAVNALTYFCPGYETGINWRMTGQHGTAYDWNGSFTDKKWSGNGGVPGEISFSTTSANDPTIARIVADVDTHAHSSTLTCHYQITGLIPNSLSPYVTQEVNYLNCMVDHSSMSITCH